LVLDASSSINDAEFQTMKAFARSVANSFVISPVGARVGVVQFSTQGRGRFDIGLSGNALSVTSAINGMFQLHGGTDIQEGIELAHAQLLINGRSNVPRVVILLTDGRHNQPGNVEQEAASARSAGVELFAIGVGPAFDQRQLAAIASDPDQTHVFSVTDFVALADILSKLIESACAAAGITPATLLSASSASNPSPTVRPIAPTTRPTTVAPGPTPTPGPTTTTTPSPNPSAPSPTDAASTASANTPAPPPTATPP
jgi:hypothetical protein